MVEQVDGIAVGLRGRGGHGSVLGGARALSALYGQSGGLNADLGRGFGYVGALGGAGAICAPSAALGRATHDGLDHRESAGSSLETAAPVIPRPRREIRNVTARAVTSWSNPTTRPWPAICGGRPASMRRAAVQGCKGHTVDISARVYTMLENLGAIYLLAFVPRGGAGFIFAFWDMRL